VAPAALPRRRRRVAIAAAVLALGGAVAATTVLAGGDQPASANTAERTADGGIVITIREGKHPKVLQRRLQALGVPAVVDFVPSGYGCDASRSTTWVTHPIADKLITHDTSRPQFVLHPQVLKAGQTAVLEFQIDEYHGDMASNLSPRVSNGPVGPCKQVPNSSVVDAKHHIAGG
jgi:hypothetical protein